MSFECSSALSAQVPKGPSSAQILRFPWSVFEKSFKIFSDYILLHTVFFFLENKMYKFLLHSAIPDVILQKGLKNFL